MVICGIGMMIFADFGKFRQAGVGITIGLIVVLIAALTFTRRCCGWQDAGPSGRINQPSPRKMVAKTKLAYTAVPSQLADSSIWERQPS